PRRARRPSAVPGGTAASVKHNLAATNQPLSRSPTYQNPQAIMMMPVANNNSVSAENQAFAQLLAHDEDPLSARFVVMRCLTAKMVDTVGVTAMQTWPTQQAFFDPVSIHQHPNR